MNKRKIFFLGMIATLFVVLVGSYFAFNEQVKAADKMKKR